jgi:hypothetical protein
MPVCLPPPLLLSNRSVVGVIMALDTTIGGSSSDSYVAVAELTAYLEAVYGDTASTFLDLEEAAKEHRLKLAALLMNNFPYRGVKASRDQRLEFPRWWRTDDEYYYVLDDEDYIIDYSEIEENAPTIPAEVGYSQMEVAYQVVNHMLSLDPLAFPEKEIKSFELGGSLALEFFGKMGANSMSKASISSLDIVYAYLGRWYKRITGGAV